MENATKALLIAVAVIIAIVIIGLALIPLTSGKKLIEDNSDMSDVEISTYNAKFEAYFGNNVTGTKVKQLIKVINQHNKSNYENEEADQSRVIEVSGVDGIQDNDKICEASKINSGGAYTVKVDSAKGGNHKGYTSGGLIKYIEIKEKP